MPILAAFVLALLLTDALAAFMGHAGAVAMQEVVPPSGDAGTEVVDPDDLPLDEQLARNYAPFAFLKRTGSTCDSSGEQYEPMPVEAVLNDPAVWLRQDTGGEGTVDDPVIMVGPSAQDLAWRDESYYLDFPGNPRIPGCGYARWSTSKSADYDPTVYARVVTEPGVRGIAVQYWFFYLFNDFNNTHEGDWEMIEVVFDAQTVEDALTQDPGFVAYAQHGGGERADWDDKKLQIYEDHPYVYPAAGSHATQFENHMYIGWGENGTGFGCDDTRTPSRRVSLSIVMLPEYARSDGEFGWLQFGGRWGEREVWEFNGTKGPQLGENWRDPISWTDDVRERSLYVPSETGLGPLPADVFCTVTHYGSRVLMYFGVYPIFVASAVLTVFFGGVVLLISTRSPLIRAMRVYWSFWHHFLAIGVVLIPLALCVNAMQGVITGNPPVEWVVEFIGRSEESRLIASLLVGSAQSILQALIIVPAIVALVDMIRRGEEPSVRLAYRRSWAQIRVLVRALVHVDIGIILRVVSIVGIPFAVRELVRWAFYPQAVMIEGARSARGATSTSAAAVRENWWRTAAVSIVFTVIGSMPGPTLGIFLLIVFAPSIELVNALSSVIYAFVVPFGTIGMTLLYLDRTGKRADPIFARIENDGRESYEKVPDRGTNPAPASGD